MGKDQIIEIREITKQFYKGKVAHTGLIKVDLDVFKGDLLSITGPSGSGKSTLLSIIGLLDRQTSGSYKLSGTTVSDLTFYQLSKLRNKHIGWVFQDFNLLPSLTALENVMLPVKYSEEYSIQDAKNRAMSALKRVGLVDKVTNYPTELSGGQQQRVAIARAIVLNPDILLADEPTGNLDSENSQKIFDLLMDLNSNGTTILMVTHESKLASACNRSIMMIDGVTLEGENHELR